MLNKYKLPYIILGLGIGIIITNFLYSFNPNVEYKEYTEEEIITAAKELGMVFIKDSISTDIEKAEVLEDTEELILIVESGDTSEEVSNKLFQLGVVENGQDFHEFAKAKNLEKKIRIGTYKLSPNMGYETIIKIITKSL